MLPVVDAAIVSGMADSTVLVAHQGVTEQASLARAHQILATRAKPDSIAVVLNEVSTSSDLYRSYFGKTTAHYYQRRTRMRLPKTFSSVTNPTIFLFFLRSCRCRTRKSLLTAPSSCNDALRALRFTPSTKHEQLW